MPRKVSVTLEADVAGFVRPVETAKVAVDDLGDKVEKLDEHLDKIPLDAAKAGTALRLLGGDVNSVGDKVDSLGTKNAGLAILDQKIKETRSEVRKLSEEFVKTGDVDVFKKLNDTSGRLAGLQAVRKKLADAIVPEPQEVESFFSRILNKAEGLGDSIGKLLPDAVTGALSTPVLGPIIAAALIAALVAAASTVLATAGGAILGAAGLGVVGGGVIGAILGDPKAVGDAWSKELSSLKAEFIEATQPVRQPLLDAVHEFGAALRGIDMAAIFGPAAKWLPQFAHGAAEFAMWIGRAVQALSSGAGPVVKVIADELPEIGQAIATASQSIADGSEGGAHALKDLLGVVEVVILGLGGMIEKAEKIYSALAKLRDFVIPRDWLFLDAPQHFETVGRALDGVGNKAHDTAVSVRGLSDAWGELRREELAYADANLAVQQGWLDLDKALKDGERTLNTNKQAGIDNTKALLNQIEVAERARDQQVALTGDVKAADAAYAANIDRIRKMALAYGFSADQVDALIVSVSALPPAKTTEIKTPGLGTALDQGISLGNALNNINGDYYARVHVTGIPQGVSLGNLLHHADGGPVYAGVPSIVGERGPEVFVPETAGMIIPSVSAYAGLANAAPSGAMSSYSRFADMAPAAAMSGGGSQTIQLTMNFSGGGDRDWLARAVQQAFYDQRIQVYANGQRVQTSRG